VHSFKFEEPEKPTAVLEGHGKQVEEPASGAYEEVLQREHEVAPKSKLINLRSF
jgi:hypothetical protein